MQEKYDKFLNDIREELNHPLRQNFEVFLRTSQDLLSSQVINTDSNNLNHNQGKPDNLEDYFESNLQKFSGNTIQIKEIIKQAMSVDLNYEFKLSIGNLVINLSDLLEQLKQYFIVFRNQFQQTVEDRKRKTGIEEDPALLEARKVADEMDREDQLNSSRANLLKSERYNEQLEDMHEDLEELNSINIERMADVRDLNNKLEVLDEHLNSLMKDIENKRRKILGLDANIIDENVLIRSYENNLKEKLGLLESKSAELKQLKAKADGFNKKIGEMFFEIIEIDKKTQALKELIKESEQRHENVTLELEQRQKNLTELKSKSEVVNREIQKIEKQKSEVEQQMRKDQGQLKQREIVRNQSKIKVNKAKDDVRGAIKARVRRVHFYMGLYECRFVIYTYICGCIDIYL